MRKRPKPNFTRRTYHIFRHQQERAKAAGRRLPYDLAQLRKKAERELSTGLCPYCLGALTVANFCCDHEQPISRDGSWSLKNVTICCNVCNQRKGELDGWEWMELLGLVGQWPEDGQRDIFRRLRAGGQLVRRR
jgi:hypothetical protein